MTSDFKLNFIGIGAERSATTWIYECLSQHSEICIPEKELFFFNEFDPHYLSVKNYRYKKGFGWLKRIYSQCPKKNIKGEFSPTYLYDKKAAERIKKSFPNVKLLVSLRDPVARAYSQYVNDTRMGVIPKMKFTEALEKYPTYIEKGYYAKYLRYYYKLFPKKNILVVFYSDIQKNPTKVMKRIYSFLGVKNTDFQPASLNKVENSRSEARFQPLNLFMMQTDYFLRKSGLTSVLHFADSIGVRKLSMKLRDLNSRPMNGNYFLDPKLHNKLAKLFAADNRDLKKIVNRSLV